MATTCREYNTLLVSFWRVLLHTITNTKHMGETKSCHCPQTYLKIIWKIILLLTRRYIYVNFLINEKQTKFLIHSYFYKKMFKCLIPFHVYLFYIIHCEKWQPTIDVRIMKDTSSLSIWSMILYSFVSASDIVLT